MPIAPRSSAYYAPYDPLSSTNTATCNAPAGIVDRDVLVAVVSRSPTASATTAITSSGWTVDSFTAANANAGPVAVLYKVAGGSEPSTYTFTSVSYTGTDSWHVQILAASGVNPSSPIAASTQLTDAGSAASSIVAPGVTVPAVAERALLITAYLAIKYNASPNLYGFTPPGTMVEQIDQGTNYLNGAICTELVVAGATGTRTATFITRSGGASTNPDNPARAVSLALRPLATPLPIIAQAGRRARLPRPRRGQFFPGPWTVANPNAPVLGDSGTGIDTVTVVDLITIADTGTGSDTVTISDASPVSSTDTGTGVDTVAVLDVPSSTQLPLRSAPFYELLVVARIPAVAGPPTFQIVDDLRCTTLDWTTELSRPQSLTVTAELSTMTVPVRQRLSSRAQAGATELWLLRDGVVVFAGPYTATRRDGETVTIDAAGLLAYAGRWWVFSDLVFSGVDQSLMVKALFDHWQARPYGNAGIDTSAVVASGKLRDGTYLAKDGHNILTRSQEIGQRAGGFDIDVDPSSRRLMLWSPQRGIDRSAGEDSIVFDSGNITNASAAIAVGADQVATVGFGTGTNNESGTGTLYSTAVNADLLAQYGAFGTFATWDSVSEQATLDGHVQALVDARGEPLVVPGPNVRVTPNADRSTYDAGDTVDYSVDDQLGVQGAFRLRSVRTSVAEDGQETVTPQFV